MYFVKRKAVFWWLCDIWALKRHGFDRTQRIVYKARVDTGLSRALLLLNI
jgi:hypothetical protein